MERAFARITKKKFSLHLQQKCAFGCCKFRYLCLRLNYILSFWRVRDKIICAKYTMFEIWSADCHIFCSCSRLTQYRPTMAELFKWATTLVWSDTRTRVTIVTPAEFKTAKKVWNLYWMQFDKMSRTVVKIEAAKSLKVQPKTGQSGEGVKIARWSASWGHREISPYAASKNILSAQRGIVAR